MQSTTVKTMSPNSVGTTHTSLRTGQPSLIFTFPPIVSGVYPCDRKPCDAQATCKNIDTVRYLCTCRSGFHGDGFACRSMLLLLNSHLTITFDGLFAGKISPCILIPCHSQATCQGIDESRYTCTCNEGYTGNGKMCKSQSSGTGY